MAKSDVLRAPHVMEYTYTRSVGPVIERFFAGLGEHRIQGIKGSDGKVIVPPTEYDPYTGESLSQLATALAPLRTDRSPFADAPRMKGATWAKPKLTAQIAFAEWTADDKLRQPVFLGLRRDKSPRVCRWEERER